MLSLYYKYASLLCYFNSNLVAEFSYHRYTNGMCLRGAYLGMTLSTCMCFLNLFIYFHGIL